MWHLWRSWELKYVLHTGSTEVCHYHCNDYQLIILIIVTIALMLFCSYHYNCHYSLHHHKYLFGHNIVVILIVITIKIIIVAISLIKIFLNKRRTFYSINIVLLDTLLSSCRYWYHCLCEKVPLRGRWSHFSYTRYERE